MWALGVITYFLLCGYTPFDRQNSMDEMHAILNAEFEFGPVEYWHGVSETGTTNMSFQPELVNGQRIPDDQTWLHFFSFSSCCDCPLHAVLAKGFVSGLLTADPTRRMTAAEALQHPWLSQDQQYLQEQPMSEQVYQQQAQEGDMEGVVQHDLLPNMMARMRARTRFRNAIQAVNAINKMRAGKDDPRHVFSEEVSHVLHRSDEHMM